MDAHHFDALTRALAPGTRRGLLATLLTLPVVGGLLALFFDLDDAEAKGRRKRRKKRHKHGKGNGRHRKGKRRKTCRRKSRAKICAGTCGIVKNKKTCKKKVDCGACCTGLLPTDNLQDAIEATPEGGTLVLCAGTWALAATITITQDLTLRGAGAGLTILDGQEQVRVLQIAAGVAVTLHDLAVTRGTASDGGGIFNEGDLTLRGVAVTDNETTLDGGGIANGGTLTLAAGSRVADNTANSDGGGIANIGTVILEDDSRVSGNTANSDGGGIGNLGTLTLLAGSRVSGNTATVSGGGIFNVGGEVTVETDAFVCDNSEPQCSGAPIGNCPSPADGECPA